MAFNLGELVFKMSADVASLKSDMGDAKKAVGEAAERIQEGAEYARKALELLGIAFGTKEMVEWVRSSIEVADQANKTAQKIGITTQALTGLQYAARLADVDAESLQTSLIRLSKNMAEAADGSKQQEKAFADLGISVKDANGGLRTADEVLGDVADRFSRYEDGAAKAALAQELFGKSGAQLIPFLNGGREGIERMREEAERLGIVISGETAAAAEEFNDNLTRLKASGEGFTNQITAEMLPSLVSITEQFTELSNHTVVAKEVADALVTGLRVLLTIGTEVATTFRDVGDALGAYAASGQQAISGIAGVAEGFMRAVAGDFSGGKIAIVEGMMDLESSYRTLAESSEYSANLIAEKDNFVTRLWDDNTQKTVESTEVRREALLRASAAEQKSAEDAQKALEKQTEALQQFIDLQRSRVSEDLGKSVTSGIDKDFDSVSKLRDDLRSQTDVIQDEYLRRKQVVIESQILTEEERDDLIGRAQKERDEKLFTANRAQGERRQRDEERGMTTQEKMWKSGLEGRLKVTGSILGTLGNLMHSHNKTAFEIGKKAATAQAIIATYTSAVEAYKSMVGIPYVGPALGVAAAAAAIASGMAQVQAINAQQFESGGGAGAAPTYSAGPGGFPTSSAGAISSDGPASLAQAQNNPSGPSITIYGDFYGDGEKVASDIKKLISDSDFVLVESTSRQASELRA